MPQPQAPVVQQPAPIPGGSENNQSALAAYLGGLGLSGSRTGINGILENIYARLH